MRARKISKKDQASSPRRRDAAGTKRRKSVAPLMLSSTFDPRSAITACEIYSVKTTDSLPLHVSDTSGETLFVKAEHERPLPFRVGASDPSGSPGLYMRRTMTNDQVALRLGCLLEAPTPSPAIVYVPRGLLDASEPVIKHSLGKSDRAIPFAVAYSGQFCHGSYEIEKLGARQNKPPDFSRAPNDEGYARLAVLYAWIGFMGDHQFFQQLSGSRRVWSIDHGFSLGGTPIWTANTLRQFIPAPTVLDVFLKTNASLSTVRVKETIEKLKSISTRKVQRVVRELPGRWVTPKERLLLAEYLLKRRSDLIR
jgi:hypothetical protein